MHFLTYCHQRHVYLLLKARTGCDSSIGTVSDSSPEEYLGLIPGPHLFHNFVSICLRSEILHVTAMRIKSNIVHIIKQINIGFRYVLKHVLMLFFVSVTTVLMVFLNLKEEL